MTHISRPFQIALVALLLLVAVWFAVLRGHSSGSGSAGSSSSASSAPSSASSSSAQSAASQSASGGTAPGGGTAASQAGAQHSSAPGVEGLSRAIQRARGAVAQSRQNEQQLQRKSAQASEEGQAQGAQQSKSQATQPQSAQAQSQSHPSSKTQSAPTQSKSQSQGAETKTADGAPAMQVKVEGELQHGKIVAVLFWNPKGSVDAVVRRELQAAKRDSHGKLAIHVARSGEVGSFGSFTHAVQVYSTPTILLINTKGQTSSLSGLTDAFSIAQAVREVKSAK